MSDQTKKRKNRSYFTNKKQKRNELIVGLKGFLCFCNFREKDCIKEAMNLLDEYENKTNIETSCNEEKEVNRNNVKSNSEDEIEDELLREIANVKKATCSKKRFQIVESGAKNILFLASTIDDPVQLVHNIVKNVYDTKEQKSRFLLRLVPIEYTCKANILDVKKYTSILIEKYFSAEPKTFSIVFNHRNNNCLSKDEVIKELAELVSQKNNNHKVNLKEPDLAIIVEVIRSMCLLSIVPEYNKYKKYNLHQLCNSNNDSENKKELHVDNTETNECLVNNEDN